MCSFFLPFSLAYICTACVRRFVSFSGVRVRSVNNCTVCDFIGNTPVSSSADGISSTWLSSLSNSFRAVCSLSAPLPTSYSHTICSFVFHTSRAVFSSSRRIPPQNPYIKPYASLAYLFLLTGHRLKRAQCPVSLLFCAHASPCFALLCYRCWFISCCFVCPFVSYLCHSSLPSHPRCRRRRS